MPVLSCHRATGDALSALYEYRGVIVDGGGHDHLGANAHGGGHVRLNPARKEILIEVDQMTMGGAAVAPNRATITGWMNTVAQTYSQQNDGAGIHAYYVIDSLATPRNLFTVNTGTSAQFQTAVSNYSIPERHVTLRDKFMHLQLVESFPKAHDTKGTSSYNTYGGNPWGASFVSNSANYGALWTNAWSSMHGANVAFNFNVLAANYILHELSHPYAFTAGWHMTDPDGNGTPNQAGTDMTMILYDYTSGAPEYRSQDYVTMTPRFGQRLLSVYDVANASSIRLLRAVWEQVGTDSVAD